MRFCSGELARKMSSGLTCCRKGLTRHESCVRKMCAWNAGTPQLWIFPAHRSTSSCSPSELQVPFHRASVGEEEVQAVSEVIRSGWLTMGPKTFEFEKEFAKYVGAQHATAVSTGTAALHLSLEAAGVQGGDEVLLPTTTFTATAEAVTYVGARPVL